MDGFIAKVQAALTFLIVGAWISLKILALSAGMEAAELMADDMKEVVMLAVGFWLLRPRAFTAAKDEEPAPPAKDPVL